MMDELNSIKEEKVRQLKHHAIWQFNDGGYIVLTYLIEYATPISPSRIFTLPACFFTNISKAYSLEELASILEIGRRNVPFGRIDIKSNSSINQIYEAIIPEMRYIVSNQTKNADLAALLPN